MKRFCFSVVLAAAGLCSSVQAADSWMFMPSYYSHHPVKPVRIQRQYSQGPVFTRPREWRGREVPPVLLSGDHAAIARWRRDEALRRTARSRPDLIRAARDLDDDDRAVLAESGPLEAGFPVSGEDVAH